MHFSWRKGRCLPRNASGAVWKGALALLLCGLLGIASALLVSSGTMAAPVLVLHSDQGLLPANIIIDEAIPAGFAQAAARLESHQAVAIFDWHQLWGWNISEQRLPIGAWSGSRKAMYWERHYPIIVMALFLCLLEALLIVALLIQLRRRRLAETALRESEQRLNLAADAGNLSPNKWLLIYPTPN